MREAELQLGLHLPALGLHKVLLPALQSLSQRVTRLLAAGDDDTICMDGVDVGPEVAGAHCPFDTLPVGVHLVFPSLGSTGQRGHLELADGDGSVISLNGDGPGDDVSA